MWLLVLSHSSAAPAWKSGFPVEDLKRPSDQAATPSYLRISSGLSVVFSRSSYRNKAWDKKEETAVMAPSALTPWVWESTLWSHLTEGATEAEHGTLLS